MQLFYATEQDLLTVDLPSRLDRETSSELERVLMDWRSRTGRGTLIDFCHVIYIDSSGLEVLWHHGKAVREINGQVVLATVRESVFQVFEINGLADTFTFAATREEGMSLLRPDQA